jgi:predicted ABC-type ATPase
MIAREHLAVGRSFGIETTLAGAGTLRFMRLARAGSYEIDFAYLGTDNVEINLQRIAARVADGGHDIDEIDVRRRYTRSLAHLPTALALADRYVLLDNTAGVGFNVFAGKDALGIRLQGTVPNWARGLDLP